MSNAPDIVGIGVCTVDHLMTVPHMPGNNVNMKASAYLRQPGGLASCALVAAARLGARTKVIARVGDDDAGQYIRQELESEGVDTSNLIVRVGSESHVSLILVDERTGDRSIMTRPPTSEPIALREIKQEDITSAKVLFIDDVTELTLQAARWAQESDMRVVLDPARPFAIIKQILPYVDVPIVPQQWAEAWMPGQPVEAVAEALFQAGAKIAVVTLGARGSVLCWEGGTRHIPAFKSGCRRYDGRWRCLSWRLHGRSAPGLGGAADGALRGGGRGHELPRYGRPCCVAYAAGRRYLSHTYK